MLKFKLISISIILTLLLSLAGPSITVTASPLKLGTSPTLTDSSAYSVLAHTSVTNTGSTTTSGEVGVESGTSITGFPPGLAGGNNATHLHSNDSSAQNAQIDNTAAYGNLSSQTCDTTYAGTKDLVGLSLVPGVYCADAFMLSGTLTLTGSGVWIFKSASTLITSGTAKIVGGDPCNVWWRVASSATLGTYTSLIGNILALASISLNTGATLNGRAMVQTAAVTLDANTISGPICGVRSIPTAVPTNVPGSSAAAGSSGNGNGSGEGDPAPNLPGAGSGAPIRDEDGPWSTDFPWSLVIVVVLSTSALAVGARASRNTSRPE